MRCHGIIACFIVGLFASTVRADCTIPKRKGETKAVLTVTVMKIDASKLPQVDYRLEVRTSRDTEVKPELTDEKEAWKSNESPPDIIDVSREEKVERFHFHLEQSKPGVLPLPGLKVRFRKGNQGEWDELTWPDILKETRPLPWSDSQPPSPTPQPSEWRLWWMLAGLALLLCGLGVSLGWLLSRKAPPPLTPAERALRELDRIEGLGLAGPDESGWFPAEISSVIRRFLSERYGLPAQQQTTAEFLQALRQTPDLLEEMQQTLKELLERCDLSKFAAQRTPPDECRRIAALARRVVQQTASSRDTLTPSAASQQDAGTQ